MNNLSTLILLSEDATAIEGRREYCTTTNSLTGFSLPLQPNGLPDSRMAAATTVESITKAFRQFSRASQEMVIMAQPFRRCGEPDPPTFRICSFATDNKFDFTDTQNRLATVVQKLQEAGLKGMIYSADGDTRELKLMRMSYRLGVSLAQSRIFLVIP